MSEDNLYNDTADRLWEKLEYHRENIDITCVDFKQPFPIDQLILGNPFVQILISEVEKEFNYQMSEFQCSWSVRQFIKGGLEMMAKSNTDRHSNMKPIP